MKRLRPGDYGVTFAVAALSSAFGVTLMIAVAVMTALLSPGGAGSPDGTLGLMLAIVASVFIAIGLYSATVIVANTVQTVIAGRVSTIGLLRLLGATASGQRRIIVAEGALVGLLGSAAGVLLGIGVAAAAVALGRASAVLPAETRLVVPASALVPALAVALVTLAAVLAGSRRVLGVAPAHARAAAVESAAAPGTASVSRRVVSVVLVSIGAALLVVGVVLGREQPAAVLVGVVGGIVSFTGIVVGAVVVFPRLLRVLGRLLGSSAPARIAAENAVRNPESTTRSVLGLIIGVTLVATFAVALASFGGILRAAATAEPELYEGMQELIDVSTAVFAALAGFSAVVAAVGVVATMAAAARQRRRETALLRALGLDSGQLRRMIVAESAQLTVAAIALGLGLGIAYGWAGAQSFAGSFAGVPGLVPPVVPAPLVLAVSVAAIALVTVASLLPIRRAMRSTPLEALASA